MKTIKYFCSALILTLATVGCTVGEEGVDDQRDELEDLVFGESDISLPDDIDHIAPSGLEGEELATQGSCSITEGGWWDNIMSGDRGEVCKSEFWALQSGTDTASCTYVCALVQAYAAYGCGGSWGRYMMNYSERIHNCVVYPK